MSEHSFSHGGPDELRAALQAADALINRIEELIADQLSKRDGIDEEESFYRIVEIFETSPEITKVRLALGQDPHRFGDPTPFAAGDKTG